MCLLELSMNYMYVLLTCYGVSGAYYVYNMSETFTNHRPISNSLHRQTVSVPGSAASSSELRTATAVRLGGRWEQDLHSASLAAGKVRAINVLFTRHDISHRVRASEECIEEHAVR
jgi:hypothetical protein